jgi:hypothetical protein
MIYYACFIIRIEEMVETVMVLDERTITENTIAIVSF